MVYTNEDLFINKERIYISNKDIYIHICVTLGQINTNQMV